MGEVIRQGRQIINICEERCLNRRSEGSFTAMARNCMDDGQLINGTFFLVPQPKLCIQTMRERESLDEDYQ